MSRAAPLLPLALLAGLAACNPQAPKAARSAAPAAAHARSTGMPPMHYTGQGTTKQPVRFVQQVHNRIAYDLLASSYESKGPPGRTRAVFQNARVTFNDRHGSRMKANAPQAIVDQSSNTVTLVGGVHARSSSGMTLQCRRLVYDRASEMLHGTGDVVITDPKGFRATGSSFDSDLSLTHIRML